MYEATLVGDYKKNNKEGRTVIELFKFLEKNLQIAVDTLPLLFDHENVVTRTKVAAHCLALKIHVDKAQKVLEDVAADNKYGIFAFNARMTLKVWHEQGFLKMY